MYPIPVVSVVVMEVVAVASVVLHVAVPWGHEQEAAVPEVAQEVLAADDK